jgi:hypothetical protein
LRRNDLFITAASVLLVAVAAVIAGSLLLSGQGGACRGLPYPSLAGQAVAVHEQVLIRVFINGTQLALPSDIGNGDSGTCVQPIQNRASDANSSVIHIESPGAANYTLGDLFAVWSATAGGGGPGAVTFNSTSLLSYRVGGGNVLRMFVNGGESTDFASLLLSQGQNIVIAYGPADGADWGQYLVLSAAAFTYP